jgi:hypothetical protein
MSERHAKVPLADVDTVAVVCNRCRTEFVYPVGNLAEAFVHRDGDRESWCCPHCRALVQGESAGAATRGPFRPLLESLNTLRDLRDRIEVRLVFRRSQGGEGGVP